MACLTPRIVPRCEGGCRRPNEHDDTPSSPQHPHARSSIESRSRSSTTSLCSRWGQRTTSMPTTSTGCSATTSPSNCMRSSRASTRRPAPRTSPTSSCAPGEAELDPRPSKAFEGITRPCSVARVSGAPRVLLITGPGASGKSTLAASLADGWGWVHLSEDEYWIDNGWGSGLRSADHERVVQAQVAIDLLAATKAGRSVALEFILYKAPPNPLTAYQKVLAENGITCRTIVLKPAVEEVVRMMMHRGRPRDLSDVERRRRDAAHQVKIVESDDVDPAWILHPTDRTLDDLCRECLARFEPQA